MLTAYLQIILELSILTEEENDNKLLHSTIKKQIQKMTFSDTEEEDDEEEDLVTTKRRYAKKDDRLLKKGIQSFAGDM